MKKINNAEGDAINSRTYSYDAANQLTEFRDNDYIESYTYDNVGNMLTKDINGQTTAYTYNAGNQLVEEAANGQTIGYKYDANGDLREKTTGEQYSYDIQGKLTSIKGNGINKEYSYNGVVSRLSETTDGETVYYVNDLNQRFEQVLNNEGVIDTFTYGLQRIDSRGETNETYLYDGRCSVVGAVNADGIMASYACTAYGELMPDSPTPKVYGYNAEATDYDTGLQYLRARYYDTSINRFFQEDDYKGKCTNPISMNRYAYTHNNPVMGIDPSGYISTDLQDKIHELEEEIVAIEKKIGAHKGFIKQYKENKATSKRLSDYYYRKWANCNLFNTTYLDLWREYSAAETNLHNWIVKHERIVSDYEDDKKEIQDQIKALHDEQQKNEKIVEGYYNKITYFPVEVCGDVNLSTSEAYNLFKKVMDMGNLKDEYYEGLVKGILAAQINTLSSVTMSKAEAQAFYLDELSKRNSQLAALLMLVTGGTSQSALSFIMRMYELFTGGIAVGESIISEDNILSMLEGELKNLVIGFGLEKFIGLILQSGKDVDKVTGGKYYTVDMIISVNNYKVTELKNLEITTRFKKIYPSGDIYIDQDPLTDYFTYDS